MNVRVMMLNAHKLIEKIEEMVDAENSLKVASERDQWQSRVIHDASKHNDNGKESA